MIRSFFSKIGEVIVNVSVIVIVIFIVGINLTSCSNNDTECLLEDSSDHLHDVTVSLSTLDFSLQSYGVTTRATAAEAEITHIALKVFDSTGNVVADTCQIATNVGESFNKLGVQLPTGTYTFVAVAHSATADNVPCATITSATEATLPEGIVPTVYAHVQQVTVTNTNNQSVTINMGTRINATLHVTSTDIVPDGVSKIAFDINPTGNFVGNETPAKFNPTTGLTIAQPRYRRALDVTSGETIDVSFNILIPADPYSSKVVIEALDDANKAIADYTRSFDAVPFQCAYITNANGTFFRYVSNSSLTFDTTTQILPFPY